MQTDYINFSFEFSSVVVTKTTQMFEKREPFRPEVKSKNLPVHLFQEGLEELFHTLQDVSLFYYPFVCLYITLTVCCTDFPTSSQPFFAVSQND